MRPFAELAQETVQKYYLIPYPPKPGHQSDSQKKDVERQYHGGVHVSRAAALCQLLIDFYKEYLPEKINIPELTPENLDLLMLAAMYHDSANTSETEGPAKEHAAIFEKDMLAAGYTSTQIQPFKEAIENKDPGNSKGSEIPAAPHSFWSQILHDADSLEIFRVVKEKFDPNYLHLTKDVENNEKAKKALDTLIETHKKIIKYIEQDNTKREISELHELCEKSENCFSTTESIGKNFLLTNLIAMQLGDSKPIILAKDLNDIPLLDLYLEKTESIFKNDKEQSAIQEQASLEQQKSILEIYKSQGVLFRFLKPERIDAEFKVLQDNKNILEENNIKNNADMIEYLKAQDSTIHETEKKVFTPNAKQDINKKFAWRPASLAHQGLPFRFFEGDVGVIINPHRDKNFIAPFQFKRNVVSNRTITGNFSYFDTSGSYKNKADMRTLIQKGHEINNRRQGIASDPHSPYFGEDSMRWTEIMTGYQPENVEGIIVGNTELSIRNALQLQVKLGEPSRPFFTYSEKSGLQPISLEQMSRFLRSSTLQRHLDTVATELGIQVEMQPVKYITDHTKLENDYTEGQGVKHTISFKNLNEEQMRLLKLFFKTKNSTIDEKDFTNDNFSSTDLDFIRGILNKIRRIEFLELNDNKSFQVDLYLCSIHKGLMNHKIAVRLNNAALENFFQELANFAKYPTVLENLKNKKEFLESLDVDKITHIQTTTNRDKEISKDNPFGLEFDHPNIPNVKCKTEFINGEPALCFTYSEGQQQKEAHLKTDLLPKISEKYYQLQTLQLEQAINLKIDHFIKNRVNPPITCSLHKRADNVSGITSRLTVSLTFSPSGKGEEADLALAKSLYVTLGLSPEKFKNSYFSKAADGIITVKIVDIQKIEKMIETLKALPGQSLSFQQSHAASTIAPLKKNLPVSRNK